MARRKKSRKELEQEEGEARQALDLLDELLPLPEGLRRCLGPERA